MSEKYISRCGPVWRQSGEYRSRCLASRAVDSGDRTAVEWSRSESAAGHRAMDPWQRNLDVLGAELFLRYRKRLLMPGIAWEIRGDYPGLSIPDLLIRVHAGRRIVRDGDDFRALEAIRSGQWERIRRQSERQPRDRGERGDWISRSLVGIGGVLFYVFCLLIVLASLMAGQGGWLVPGCGLGIAAIVSLRHLGSVEG